MRPGLRTGGILFSMIIAGLLVAAVRGGLRASDGAHLADRVLGQIDFVKNQVNFVDAIGMNAPADVAVDKANGHVLVADSQNNRVMGWKSASAFAAGGAADLVIGQPDFNSSACNQNAAAPDATTLCRPIGVAFDLAHRVYVGDAQNNRVLAYNDPFAVLASLDQASDFAAVAVFGQAGSFVTSGANEGGLSADSLDSPQGVAIDATGNLFVADVNNNRALIFFAPFPMTMVKGTPGSFGDATADIAIGQPDLVSGTCNQGGAASIATLCFGGFFGVGIAVDGSDNLYIGDTLNNRALEYNGPFGYGQTNNPTPDLVFEGNNLVQPTGVAVDSNQNFYVSSESHNQVYEYTQPVPLMRTDLLNLQIGPGRAESECGVAAISDGAWRLTGSTIFTSPTRRTTGCWSSTSSDRPATRSPTAPADRSIDRITGRTSSMRSASARRAESRWTRPRSRRIDIYMSPTPRTIACSDGGTLRRSSQRSRRIS